MLRWMRAVGMFEEAEAKHAGFIGNLSRDAAESGDLEVLASLHELDMLTEYWKDSELAFFVAECFYGDDSVKVKILEWLLDQGLWRVNDVNEDGQTVAHIAAEMGLLEIIQWFHKSGNLNVDLKDNNGNSVASICTYEIDRWLTNMMII